MKFGKIAAVCISLLLFVSVFTGCNKKTSSQTSAVTTSLKESDFIKATYSSEDKDASYNESTATKITLNKTAATISGSGAKASKSKVTITSDGTYIVTGTLEDGQIVVSATKEATVHIVLKGVNITCSDNSAIYSSKSKKTIITLADGTENTITDGKKYSSSDDPDSTLFVKDDLTINGGGKLTVNANYKNAVTSKDNLVITGGTIIINAANNGICGRDSVAVFAGAITIVSGNDGIKSSNDEDTKKGWISLDGGTYNITSQGDAVQAERTLYVSDGIFNIETGGGSSNSAKKANGQPQIDGNGGTPPQGGNGTTPPQDSNGGTPPQGGNGETPPQDGNGGTPPQDGNGTAPPQQSNDNQNSSSQNTIATSADVIASATKGNGKGNTNSSQATQQGNASDNAQAATTQDETSSKGLKATYGILAVGGTFKLNTSDDSVHTNGTAIIKSGSFTVSAGDDAFHADLDLNINGGKINISTCYEGLEGKIINITSGEIVLTASDDGVNASDKSSSNNMGQMQGSKTASTDCYIKISGGKLTVTSVGDGIDSNGSIYISGGTVIVDGPVSGGDGALDYNNTCEITGGTIIAVGNSQMAESATNNICSIELTTASLATQTVAVTDKNGNILLAYTPLKNWNSAVMYTPSFKQGETVSVYTGAALSAKGLLTDGKISDGTLQGTVTLQNSNNTVGTKASQNKGNFGGGKGPGGGN